MKILFLGYEKCRPLKFLKERYDVFQTSDRIIKSEIERFDYIISYGYKHILKKDFLLRAKNKVINLHISYLPWNRGTHPNFWSFVDDTPKGVTIHYIDEGIDTGDILVQKEVFFDEKEDNLEKTYYRLKNEIEDLFIESWDSIVEGNLEPFSQCGEGSFHTKKDKNKCLGWKTPIEEIKKMKNRTHFDVIDEVEKIREKNNTNWMDILRLAFRHAPEEAKVLMGKINNHDSKIASLLKELSDD